ncbi:hypothetical protein JYG23_07765 [Sedimentibacter sp. zth1]|uniref:S41 family peptidase n=1 Tax=Sedimentibacter sp. zth1 TaxID=2816908 RepID=UPI001A91F499|nr:S41 family peptidase [Sedimentibacter sp. zth1]QSX07229.1 hypothetical protein JYG23_07765 [Sedimentibacter sp. zth1]
MQDVFALYICDSICVDKGDDNFLNYVYEYAACKYLQDGDKLSALKFIGDINSFDVEKNIETTCNYLNYSFFKYINEKYTINKIVEISKMKNNIEYLNIFNKTLDELRKEWIHYELNNNCSLVDKMNIYGLENGITEEELIQLSYFDKYFNLKKINSVDKINKDEAIYDVNLYFKLLKATYGAYNYLGGDEQFETAYNNIVDALSTKEIVCTNELEEILRENLKFVHDSHFTIGNSRDYNTYYFNEDYNISYEKNNYYMEVDDKKYKILKINNDENIDQYIKPSLNANGQMSYAIYIEGKSKQFFINRDIELDNNNSIKYITIKLNEDVCCFQKPNKIFEYNELEGIPVLTIKSMSNVPLDKSALEWIKSANLIKDKQYAIVDLRGNSGGRGEFCDYWIEELTGQLPVRENSSYIISSKQYIEIIFEILNYPGYRYNKYSFYYPSLYETLDEMINESKDKMEIKEDKKISVEKINTEIYVLYNKSTASAAECLIEALNDVENVTFVGTNSSGALLSNVDGAWYLPNSHISVNMGYNLHVIEDENFKEGEGFEPDIWCNSKDCLERVIKIIQESKDGN